MAYKLDFRPKNMACTSPYMNVVRTPLGVEHRSLRLYLFIVKTLFLIISTYRCPKMAFPFVNLGKMPFWGFHGQKWREIYVFIINTYSLSDLWVKNGQLVVIIMRLHHGPAVLHCVMFEAVLFCWGI